MFGTTLTITSTVMHIYVFWRALSVPAIKRYIPRKYIFITAIFMWALFLAGRTYGHGGEGTLAATIELLGMNWLATLFLIMVTLLVIDTITFFGCFLPRLAPSLRGWALMAGIALAAFANVQGLRPPAVTSHELYLSGLPEKLNGTVLVVLSDMHLGSLIGPSWLEARVSQIREEHPDLVLFVGDNFEGHGSPREAFIPLLRRLTPPMGVLCVPGNHGSRTSMAIMKEAGFEVVENCWKEVAPGLVVAGVPARHRDESDHEAVTQALSGSPPGATLLLAHKPGYEYAEAAARSGVALMLSGHTHGGQVWPFDYLVRYAYPLLEGRYEVEGMTVIVGRGAGTWGPRMRLWERGEILRITLYAKKEALP